MSRKVTFTDTECLLSMARKAQKLNTNRQVDVPALIKDIDPDGHHIAGMSFPHEAYGTSRLDMRTHWFVKLTGSSIPAQMWLDVPITMFTALTTTGAVEVTEELAKAPNESA